MKTCFLPLRFSVVLSIAAVLATFSLGASSAEEADAPDSGNLRTFLELARVNLRADKAMLVAENMDFTEDEAVEFWPVYSDYEQEVRKWYDKRLALIRDYAEKATTLTDSEAQKVADEVFGLEEARTQLKRKFFKKFSKVVGAKKTARFFQIENQLNAAIDLHLAAAVPLIK